MANKNQYIKNDKLEEMKTNDYKALNGKLFYDRLQLWKKENNKTNNDFLSLLEIKKEYGNETGIIKKWKNGTNDITNSKHIDRICEILNIEKSEFLQPRKIIVTPPLQLVPYKAIDNNFHSDYQLANFIINNIETRAFYSIKEIRSQIEKCEYATVENVKALIDSYNEFDKKDTLEFYCDNNASVLFPLDHIKKSWLIFSDPFDNYKEKIASVELIQSFIDNVYCEIIDKLEIRQSINELPSDDKRILYPELFR